MASDKQSQADAIQWAQDAAHSMIVTQLSLGGVLDEDAEAVKRVVSAFGFGYIFGFADQLLQRAGVTDEVQTLTQLAIVLTRLFGKDRGPKIFGKCLRQQDDPEFRAARLLGAQEVRTWLEHPDKAAPMGLAQYLNGKSAPIARQSS